MKCWQKMKVIYFTMQNIPPNVTLGKILPGQNVTLAKILLGKMLIGKMLQGETELGKCS